MSVRCNRICLQCGRPGFDPWIGKTPGEGKGYPLRYSGLENSLDHVVHGVTKSRTLLSDFHFHFQGAIGLQCCSSPLFSYVLYLVFLLLKVACLNLLLLCYFLFFT